MLNVLGKILFLGYCQHQVFKNLSNSLFLRFLLSSHTDSFSTLKEIKRQLHVNILFVYLRIIIAPATSSCIRSVIYLYNLIYQFVCVCQHFNSYWQVSSSPIGIRNQLTHNKSLADWLTLAICSARAFFFPSCKQICAI